MSEPNHVRFLLLLGLLLRTTIMPKDLQLTRRIRGEVIEGFMCTIYAFIQRALSTSPVIVAAYSSQQYTLYPTVLT